VRRGIYECSFAAFIGVLALASLVHAQAASATVGGAVLDESGAVVPSVRIAIVNLGTGLERDFVLSGTRRSRRSQADPSTTSSPTSRACRYLV